MSSPSGYGLADDLRKRLAEEIDAAVTLRHELHAGAEVSGSEHRTGATMARVLGEADAPVLAGTGRIIRIGPSGEAAIAVRAELDALPITEPSEVPWASRTGAMHACGHDVHMAGLAALGRAVRAAREAGQSPVPLLAVLQPREETVPSGARDLVTSGALAAHHPAAMVAVHLQHQLPAGTVAAVPGTVNAATDDFTITVQGKGGHGGYPQLTADPVVALCSTVVALQQIVSRRADPIHSVVVSVCALEAVSAPNVIPSKAVARGTLRVLDDADRPAVHAALRDIVAHTCQAGGCRGTVAIEECEPALTNDAALAAAVWPRLREAGFEVNTSLRSCGADDFAYYTAGTPSLMLFLGTGGPASLHSPDFLPGDDLVGQVGSAMLAGYLGAHDFLRSATLTDPVSVAKEPRS